MKNVMMATLLLLASCADSKNINGFEFDSVGLADDKHPCVKYDVVVGNIVWSVILSETIAAPVYFVGWSIFEPIKEKYPGCLKDYAAGKRLRRYPTEEQLESQ